MSFGLVSLELANTGLSKKVRRLFFFLISFLPQLFIICLLSGCPCLFHSIETKFAHLGNFNQLTSFYYYSSSFLSPSLVVSRFKRHLFSLSSALDVSNNSLGPEGIASLSDWLAQPNSLKKLNLANTTPALDGPVSFSFNSFQQSAHNSPVRSQRFLVPWCEAAVRI